MRTGAHRAVLGVDIGDSENETFWTDFLRDLRDRGLSGVRLVISDAHKDLRAAIRRVFQNTAWQRCRVHATRKLLARCKHQLREVPALLGTSWSRSSGLGWIQRDTVGRWSSIIAGQRHRFGMQGTAWNDCGSECHLYVGDK